MMGHRAIWQIQVELDEARKALCGNLPTHERVGRVERLYDELSAAKAADLRRAEDEASRPLDTKGLGLATLKQEGGYWL